MDDWAGVGDRSVSPGARRVLTLAGTSWSFDRAAARLTTDAVGVHGVWVNGRMVANDKGQLESAPLAGELITSFSG